MNLEILDKLRDLLSSIEPENYRQTHPQFFDSSIGGHVRHILDFYDLFFEGVDSGNVDYTKRKRDAGIEQEPSKAKDFLDSIREKIRVVTEKNLKVISEANTSTLSSCGRELEFLASHAVHHNAMIIAMTGCLGVPAAKEMAFAQSTLDYQQASA